VIREILTLLAILHLKIAKNLFAAGSAEQLNSPLVEACSTAMDILQIVQPVSILTVKKPVERTGLADEQNTRSSGCQWVFFTAISQKLTINRNRFYKPDIRYCCVHLSSLLASKHLERHGTQPGRHTSIVYDACIFSVNFVVSVVWDCHCKRRCLQPPHYHWMQSRLWPTALRANKNY